MSLLCHRVSRSAESLKNQRSRRNQKFENCEKFAFGLMALYA